VARYIPSEDAGESGYLDLEPIIGWEIERQQYPYPLSENRPGEWRITRLVVPLTAGGDADHVSLHWAIRRPDGVFEVSGVSFTEEVDALEYLQGEYEYCERARFLCLDCNVNTHDIGEYYAVEDEVWRAAHDGPGMLCIDCLEKRIGRQLTQSDFKDNPLNYPDGTAYSGTGFEHKSARLKDRLARDDLQ
jgi:hypothetical protein